LAIIWHVTASYAPSNKERRAILEAHTKIRESVNPTASDMHMMAYSSKMERMAETMVDKCLSIKQRDYRGFSVNQIVFFHVRGDYEKLVTFFAKQARQYDYRTNGCSKLCEGYKKIVWANSTEVGCARKRCGFSSTGKIRPGDFVVCVYNSESVRGQRPYKEGISCSQCPPGEKCSRNQCVTPPIAAAASSEDDLPPISSESPET
uniref:SCP domain-containing protein n=1 Tax=Mesocestoides corti TaxID=53468 RepID=A0A5K3EPM4_MESCO